MADVTAERWVALRQRRAPHEFVVEPVTTGFEDCVLGVDSDGRLHLLVGVEVEPISLPPDLQSIEVRLVENARTWIDVSARSHHEDLFTMLANKIVYAIRVEGRDPAVAVEKTIEELRAALRPVSQELSEQRQIGLFGELWALSNILFPTLGSRVCHLWSGPDSERHDFVGDAVHVEVKTTTRSEQKHEISRLDQLRAPQGKRLLLISVTLERSLGGSDTLADLIDEIIGKLDGDSYAIDTFETGLKKVGWHNGLRQSGALIRLNHREVHVFEVEGPFPRLPDNYEPPRGVTSIRYMIDVSALPSLSVPVVEAILRKM